MRRQSCTKMGKDHRNLQVKLLAIYNVTVKLVIKCVVRIGLSIRIM
jgi:hypothetical protein